MRYFLLDKIQHVTLNRSIRAVKNVALSEDVYTDHFLAYPIMPGALMIECLAQAGTALLEISRKFTVKALLIMVEQAKFRSLVTPGDQLLVGMDVIALDERNAQMDGEIHVNSKLVMNARLTFSMSDSAKIYPEKTRYLMEMLYDIWLREATIIDPGEHPNG
jgi:3-hydroxyacyl-[acyl-carrier-protein] dehydratase